MNKILLTIVAALMTAVCAKAQKIHVVDTNGIGIPMVSVLGEDGTFIGTTDLDGVLSDVKGAGEVTLTHVAYKSKKVKVGQGDRILLDDADFDIPEIVVTKKPLVYVQTYYRIFYMNEDPDDACCYYRTGVLDNSYVRETKKVSIDEDHFSTASMGFMKTILNTFLGPFVNRFAGLKTEKVEKRIKDAYKELDVELVPDGPGKQLIKDKYGVVGSVADYQEKGERRYSYEHQKLNHHLTQATGSEKKIAKAEKREERQKNRKDQDFIVYRIDEQGNYAPEDFVMSQNFTSYDEEKNGRTSSINILMQTFTVDRSYVTKEELKQIKKENKMKMTYENILEFERRNKIPALPEVFQKRIDEMVKKDK